MYTCDATGILTDATLTCKPPPTTPICCQSKPNFPNYKKICIKVSDVTSCIDTDPAKGYGKTCEWTCGECDANGGASSKYQPFCHQHDNINSCGRLNATCHWTPIGQ